MYSVDFYSDVISSFQIFLNKLEALCNHVLTELKEYPTWIDDGEGRFIQSRKKAVYAIKQISPRQNLSPTETYVCPGAIGATAKTFRFIDKLNESKDTFRETVLRYKKIHKENPTLPVRQVLAKAGYGGVKLMQVYRHITYIDFHPQRIAWSKSKNASYKKITIKQAKEKLLKVGKGRHIDIQMAKLSLLKPPNRLVIYRTTRDYWGVNALPFRGVNGRDENFRIRYESLPIFYSHNKKLASPIVCFSNKDKTHIRKDKKIEGVPFLKSIRAYRYK